MKTTTQILVIIILLLLIPLSFLTGRWTAPRPVPPDPQIDTVWVADTAKQVDSKPAGSIIATLPVVRPAKPKLAPDANLLTQNANLLTQCADSLHTCRPDSALSKTEGLDSIPVPKDPPDSVTVEIPIEQRTYEGEHYRAVVQGYRPELVSIDIRLPQCPTSTSSDSKARFCWTITIGPQWGYGITPQGWQPYAGVGGSLGLSFCF